MGLGRLDEPAWQSMQQCPDREFLRTLKVERVHVGDCGTLEDVAADLPHLIHNIRSATRLRSEFGHLSPNRFEVINAPGWKKEH